MSEHTTEIPIEAAFAKLDEMLDKLESPEVSLEESFALYRSGMELLQTCNSRIDQVEKQVQMLSDDGTLTAFQ